MLVFPAATPWAHLVGCWLLVVGCWLLVVGCWLLVARGDCGSAHSKVATFEKIDKRTIGNRLAPQIDKRAIDNA